MIDEPTQLQPTIEEATLIQTRTYTALDRFRIGYGGVAIKNCGYEVKEILGDGGQG